jgi:ABC-type transport system substrate-binding protein
MDTPMAADKNKGNFRGNGHGSARLDRRAHSSLPYRRSSAWDRRSSAWPRFWAALCTLLALATSEAADPRKVIRQAYTSPERGFDCARESDEFTGMLCDNIFDALLQYDHLARPVKLQPRAAAAMPEISADGRTYTIRLKPGIHFTPDPAFGGKRRELTAEDYVYSFKRIFDPTVRAQWLFLLEGKIAGAEKLQEEARRTGKFDYDKPIEGLQALDRYTLRLQLVEPDYNLLYILTMPAMAAVAREVVEKYGDGFAEHPVGTGPYKLGHWRRSSRIVLEANPDFRGETFVTAGGENERDRKIEQHLAGKTLPLVGRIEVYVIEERQPEWLAFLNAEHDFIRPIPPEFIDVAMPGGRLAPNLARRGVVALADDQAWITYTIFNMQDPTVGGYTPEKVALRRAMSLAYPIHEEIAIVYKNQALKVDSPIAPGMAGYTPESSPTLEYNPAKAKALLDMFGYLDRDGDGWRELPDGSPLVVDQASVPEQRARQRNELWRRSMEAIGIRMTFNKVEKMPELRRLAQNGRIQSMTYGWIADYPDGENFLQLFWGKSIGGANYAMFDHPDFNRMYERIKFMPDSPERTAIYREMVKLVWVYNPWRVNSMMRNTVLVHPWVLGYKKHPFAHEPFRYLDVDLERLKASER